ncbi:MAG: ribosome assembly RNA-binding protein YhbY [Francisellaceae bacterium]
MTTKQKQAFKAQAHKLKPVVLIGDKGLSEAVIAEIDAALLAHELIKVKIAGAERDVRRTITDEICQKSACELVQIIGNISVLYRLNPQKKKK